MPCLLHSEERHFAAPPTVAGCDQPTRAGAQVWNRALIQRWAGRSLLGHHTGRQGAGRGASGQ
eukprot:228443-Hanusia_phi.AAC.1